MHSRGEAAFLIGRRSISRSRQEQPSRKPLRGESTCQEGVLVVGESEREMSSNRVSGQLPGCRPVRGKARCEVVSTIGIYRQGIGRRLPKVSASMSASIDSPWLWT
jgi:hypothetical protein